MVSRMIQSRGTITWPFTSTNNTVSKDGCLSGQAHTSCVTFPLDGATFSNPSIAIRVFLNRFERPNSAVLENEYVFPRSK